MYDIGEPEPGISVVILPIMMSHVFKIQSIHLIVCETHLEEVLQGGFTASLDLHEGRS